MKKINLARLSQLIFLAIFLVLFVNTEYRYKDEIPLAINSFFRADPLIIISYSLATWTFLNIFLPGILVIVFTILLGRFFCGWICPLGTVIDLFGKKIKNCDSPNIISPRTKYFLLTILLVMALFKINVAGLFDPIAILVRFLTFSIYPLLGFYTKEVWRILYRILGENRDYIEPFYAFVRDNLLPFRTNFYPLAFFSFLIIAFIFFLERYERRNWCKNLCPLGTLLGLLGSFSLFKRIPVKLCKDCQDCNNLCPTAFDQEILNQTNCILCLNCYLGCKNRRVSFPFALSKVNNSNISFNRRAFFYSFLGGLFLSKVLSFRTQADKIRLLRPPGVTDEEEFLKKCVRCGECMKICLRNALYPALFQAGLYGLATPVLIPREGYCEYNCTLCGQVCPTKAIPELSREEKNKAVIGIAVFDKNHCLPYAKKVNCIVCEEHCPVPEKAIKLEIVEDFDYNGNRIKLKRPYVDEKLCIGCGICENKCPLEKAGIEVFAKPKEV